MAKKKAKKGKKAKTAKAAPTPIPSVHESQMKHLRSMLSAVENHSDYVRITVYVLADTPCHPFPTDLFPHKDSSQIGSLHTWISLWGPPIHLKLFRLFNVQFQNMVTNWSPPKTLSLLSLPNSHMHTCLEGARRQAWNDIWFQTIQKW